MRFLAVHPSPLMYTKVFLCLKPLSLEGHQEGILPGNQRRGAVAQQGRLQVLEGARHELHVSGHRID